jgi:hypothetical protein
MLLPHVFLHVCESEDDKTDSSSDYDRCLCLCVAGASGGEHLETMWGIPEEVESAGLSGGGGQRSEVRTDWESGLDWALLALRRVRGGDLCGSWRASTHTPVQICLFLFVFQQNLLPELQEY